MKAIVFSSAVLIVSALQYFAVEIAAHSKNSKVKFKYIFTGIFTYMFFDFILLFLFNNIKAAYTVSALVISVLAIANHYVYDMHGTPFTMDIIKNAGTALNVLSAYKINVDTSVIAVIISAAMQIYAANVWLVYVATDLSRKKTAVLLLLFVWVFYCIYLKKNSLVPKDIVTWPWTKIISEAGYISGFVQSTVRLLNIVQPVEGYDEKETQQFAKNYNAPEAGAGKTPDIIFILNETLFDLNKITDTGEKTLEYINSLENAARGYAVCPAVGGGTNKSEYEFLTSNSLYTAPNITPFYSIDIKDSNSVAAYLKSNGYTTLATHPAPGSNYSRTAGYKNLGFDKSCFIEDYTDIQHFGSRQFATDESAYSNFIKMYENMGEGPRFAYLLTIQNHGGYIFNKPEENTVNIKKDFGAETGKINEFLSCMQLSDKAFEKIIEYFEKSDRDVVLCMMGDHAPDFAKNIIDSRYSEDEKELLLRSVPYVIWSNSTDLSEIQLPHRLAMPFVAPLVCSIAGSELCGYYKYILELSRDVPVVTSYGKYQDKNENIYSYSNKNEYSEKINRYFDFVYSNMKKKEFMKNFTR
ncbi:MAG: LTA synthase family protein [Oscillospiraceae bacterium]|nr:LTA synthase family protein [Oscillospiraceae bacterium]